MGIKGVVKEGTVMDAILQFDFLDAYHQYTFHERKKSSAWAFALRRRISASNFASALHVPGSPPPPLVSHLGQRLLAIIEAEEVA